MKSRRKIDATLRLIGNAQPPAGLERRIHARLGAPRRGFPAAYSISAAAIAASVVIAAAALSPPIRRLTLRKELPEQHIMAHSQGAFGAASAVHVPSAPVPVRPTPVGQGRGHTRSRRAIPPSAERAPLTPGLVQGVAVPHLEPSRIPSGANTSLSALPAYK